ncbi:hypothetical protein MEX01_10310 [Methylorubrum extorquens]|nr:hypothetical protein MEX01_10310 [Methylorubrum extorquens]
MARTLRALRARGEGGEDGKGREAGEEDATHGTSGLWDGEPEAVTGFSGAARARGNLSSTLAVEPLKPANAPDPGWSHFGTGKIFWKSSPIRSIPLGWRICGMADLRI